MGIVKKSDLIDHFKSFIACKFFVGGVAVFGVVA
jgi:hypothetical protein